MAIRVQLTFERQKTSGGIRRAKRNSSLSRIVLQIDGGNLMGVYYKREAALGIVMR